LKEELKISVVQMASGQAVFDPVLKLKNLDKILKYLEEEASVSDLVVFPELSIGGYIPLRGYVPELKSKFWEISEDVPYSSALEKISEIADKHGCLCIVGFSERSRVKFEVFNSAAIIGPGKKAKFSRKLHIPTEENHYFTPGSRIEVFDTHVGKIGVAICYDFLFPEMIRIMALKGAEIIVIISAVLDMGNFRNMSYFVPVARAIENQVHVVFCNGCGMLKSGKQPIGLLGDSKIISSSGEIVSRADGASECIVRGTVSEEGLKQGSSFLAVFRERQPNLYGPLLEPLDITTE